MTKTSGNGSGATSIHILLQGKGGIGIRMTSTFQGKGFLYPQVVVPTDRAKSFICPRDHMDLAKAFIQNCGHFLLIGFCGRDEDVVDLFQEMPSHSRLAIVSKGDARKIHTRMSSRVVSLKSKKLTLSFHEMGFSKFLGHKAFEQFLQV